MVNIKTKINLKRFILRGSKQLNDITLPTDADILLDVKHSRKGVVPSMNFNSVAYTSIANDEYTLL